MPELSSIQTYELIQDTNFRPVLDRFSNVLKNIDVWNKEIEAALDAFEWKVENDGLVYSSIMQLHHFTTKFSVIKIRPLVMVYSTALDETFKDDWLCCQLLIETEGLMNFVNGQYHRDIYKFIEFLIFEMRKEFKQTGIYFADEAQDGGDFDGIRCNDRTKLWQFDYAHIPHTLEHLYSIKPGTHQIKQHENYLEAWYIDRWKRQAASAS